MNTLDLGSWCILRMASADTLKVVDRLCSAGLEVWTPTEWSVARTKKVRARFDKPHPVMPSYAFAKVDHVSELLSLALRPWRGLPRFSVFHYKTGIPLIADDQLEYLRAEEARLRRLFERSKIRGAKGPVIGKGSMVRMPNGAFEGLTGIVEGQQGQLTLVAIPGFHKPIKVASCLLIESVARDVLPYNGKAARAA